MAGEGFVIPKSARIIEANLSNLNILDITTPEGRDVIAGLKPKTKRGSEIVQAAKFDQQQNDKDSTQLNNNFWNTTKYGSVHKEALRKDIVEPLKSLGYDGIFFQDDQNKTYALFDTSKVKNQLGGRPELELKAETAEETVARQEQEETQREERELKKIADLERDLFKLEQESNPVTPPVQQSLFDVNVATPAPVLRLTR